MVQDPHFGSRGVIFFPIEVSGDDEGHLFMQMHRFGSAIIGILSAMESTPF
jgi:hypothetical protein